MKKLKLPALIFFILVWSYNIRAQTAVPNPVCYGSPIYLFCGGLQGCGEAGSIYSWSDLSSSWTSTDENPVIPPNSPGYHTGQFFLAVQFFPSGMSSGSANVVVTPPYTIVVNATSTTVCAGTPVTLSGSGALTYTWDNGVIDGVPFVPLVTTTYTVTGYDLIGCTSTAQATVTVNQLPLVVANTTASAVCTGMPVTLTGSGAVSYAWDNGVTDGVAFIPAVTKTYTVTGTGANGCTNTAQVTVTVNTWPTVVAHTTASAICAGTSVTLTGSGASTYAWDNGVINGVPFTPLITKTYTVTGTDMNGCSNTAQVTVTVNPLPAVVAHSTATIVCAGASVTLTGSGAVSYAWDNGVTNGVAFIPAVTKTYTVTGTGANGCTNTAQITVTVNPLPTVVAHATASTVCAGTPVTLTGSGAVSYAWDNGVMNGVAFVPLSTKTYTVTGTDANGCTNTAQITITVNLLPPVIAHTTAAIVCSGTSVTLTGSGAVSYAWDNGVTDGIAFIPVVTKTYTVTGTGANGCTSTAQVTVTVNPLPAVVAHTTAPAVCTGTSIILTGSGANTYAWDNGVTNGVAFIPLITKTYTVTGTDANGCSNTAQVTVTVNSIPTVVAHTTASPVCAGTPVILTGSGAVSYAWDNGVTNGLPFVPATTKTYTVTGTDANGCSNTAQVTVTVNPLPPVVANTTATAVCTGTPVTLTGTGAVSYAWDNGVTNGVAFIPAVTKTYTVTGTGANGCTNTAQVTVTVNPWPTVVAQTTASTVCIGSFVTLTGSGANTYAWNNGVINGVAFIPLITKTYTVTGTDANGCSNTAQVTVTVSPVPTVVAHTTASIVCGGTPVTLTGSGAVSYAWDNGVTNGVAFVPATTKTYTVTGTDANGCTNTAQVTVTVNPLPAVVAHTSASAVCTGSPVTLTGSGAVSYTWNNGVLNGVAFVPSSTLTYTVQGTDANGCTNTAQVTVTVNPWPAVVAHTTASTVCEGSFVTLTGTGANTYAWDNGVINGVAFIPSSTKTYTVTGTDANGCSNTAQVTVTISPVPTVVAQTTASIVCQGTPVTLTGSGAVSYAWDNGVINGIAFIPATTKTYTVTGSDANGCTNTAQVTVTVNPLPAVVAHTSASAVCTGFPVTLTGSGAVSYAWNNGVINGVAFVPSSTLTYTVTGTGANGCTGTAQVTVSVNPVPAVVAHATASAVCAGTTVMLTGTGAVFYAWDNGVINGVAFIPVSTTTYNVTGTDANGCTGTSQVTVIVNPLPVVVASATASPVCAGNPVTLTGSGAVSYAWDNGVVNGVAFIPSSTTTYTVTGTDANGCSGNAQVTVAVDPLPSVAFTSAVGNQNFEILFTNITPPGVGNNLLWDFGDGIFGYGQDPSHIYQMCGNYNVGLTATDATTGCSNSIHQMINVPCLPSAFFTSDSPKCAGDTMHFTPQIPGLNILKETWDFGDGTIITYLPPLAFPVFASHAYPAVGTFTVTRTVTNIYNYNQSNSIQVVVYPLPTANFAFSNNASFPNSYACANQAVYFTDLSSSTSGSIIQWAWDFDDMGSGINNSSIQQNPSHVFSLTNHLFHVSLTVTDNVNNCTKKLIKDVFVHEPIPVDFIISNNPCKDQVLTFNADLGVMTPANIATWDWDFGDGTTHSTNPISASHLYGVAGTYTVILTVTDLNGCTNSLSKTVNVMPMPVSGFSFASPTCDGLPVLFTDQSYVPAGFPGFINTWVWTWGDGTSTTISLPGSPNVGHIFPIGVYNFNVKLTVTSSFGCKDSITHAVNIIPAPTAAFEVLPGSATCATQVVQFQDLSQTNGGGNIVSWYWTFDDAGSGLNNNSTSPSPSHTFALDGIYKVVLKVTNANGCSNSDTIPITIHKLPVADFTATSACAGSITQFTDTSIPNAAAITSYSWVFGDGGTSSLQSPPHAYATYGVYNVTLTIVNLNGCISSVTKQVTVSPNPVPQFTFTPASCIGNPVSFTDLSFIPSGFSGYDTLWTWDFHDGTPRQTIHFPNSPNIIHTFAGTATSFGVTLVVTTTNHCSDSITKTVNLIPSPIADFYYSNTTCLGQVVHFTDISQPNGGGAIQSWNWDFGDLLSGLSNTSTLQNPNHTFSAAGSFWVVLKVTSLNGCLNTDSVQVHIDSLPVANFTNTVACESSATTFTDGSTTPPGTVIISYTWNFGDNTQPSNQQSPQHTYAAFGTYGVTLTIVNSKGCIHSITKQVTVNPRPVPDFTFSPSSCVGLPVNFHSTSYVPSGFSSYITTWIWTWDDGTDTTIYFPGNPDVTHIFGGLITIHNVKLRVITFNGCTDSITKTVTSIPSPIADFYFSNTTCLGQLVNFFDLTQPNGGGSLQSWYWDFGDPLSGGQNHSTLQNPSHAFTSATNFTVTLTVTSSSGCTSTHSLPVTINALPTADYTYTVACEGSPTTFTDGSSTTPPSTVVSYAWNFGDNSFSNAQSPQHIFAAYGYYSVTLTVTNSNGCIHSVTKQVLVNPKPIPDFSFSSGNCVGNPVSFFDQSIVPTGYSSSIASWHWDFGDGSSVPTILYPGNPNIIHTFQGNGTSYVVTLKDSTTSGCVNTISKTVTLVPSPTAGFYYSSTLCDNQPVQFTDNSQTNGGGNIQSWNWNFGDPASGPNNTSTIPNPVHQFSSASPPAFSVTLIVTNGNGCKDTLLPRPQLTINARPVSNFHADTACQGSLTTFNDLSTPTGSIVSYLWDFGDGQPTASGNPTTHLYANSGVYNVKLTVSNNQGCIRDTIKPVLVLGKPVALFSASSPNCAGDSVQFTDMSSTPHGYIYKWIWHFDDASADVAITYPNNQNIKHKFANGGTYNVKLTIKTSDSCTVEKITPVQIGYTPIANFYFGTNACAGTDFQFNDNSQTNGGPPLNAWLWNFGDPATGPLNTSTLPNPLHAFSAGGTFTVRLQVTNASGCIDSIAGGKPVTVNAAPVAIFSADTVCMTSPTQFTDASTPAGSVVAWNWIFGDPASGPNNTSTLQNPTHTYNTQGSYTVSLTVTNTNQCPHDTSMQINVYPKPTAMFNYSAACVNTGTQFTDLSLAPGNSIQSWNWNFGDGTPPATVQNPIHVYTTAGTFQVTLTVKNLFNCSDSITLAVQSRPQPVAAFTYLGFFCPKGKVDFQDKSTASGSAIVDREWIFMTGYTSNIANPSFTFPVTDTTYLVTLIVTDTYGCKDTIVDSVFVKPGFTIAFTNDTVCQGYPTHFYPKNLTPGDTIYSVSWNFDDPASGPKDTSFLYTPTHTFSLPGIYVVTMRCVNSDNCADSVYREVLVYAAPKPGFSFISTPCDSTVHFHDSTQYSGTGSIASWKWNWGDGTPPVTITAPGPGDTSHLYVNAGIYPVQLVITNIHGCVDSITTNVERFSCIKAVYTNNDILCARYRIAFSDSSSPVSRITQWHWSWGDGKDTTYTKHGNPVYHTFADSGTYHVNLAIQALVDGKTIVDSVSTGVKIHPTPLTCFSNVPACLHQVSLFRDTSKTWGEKNTKWSWTFSPKTTDTSTFKTPGHKYDTAGIYNVKLVVMNKYGCKDSLTKPTRVFGLPVAHYENTAACAGDQTFFTDKSVVSDTTIGVWKWFFGDPSTLTDTSSLKDPGYRYPTTGDFTVRMIVKDHFGCIDTVDSTVRVNITPVSSFTIVNGYEGKQGQVKLNNFSRGAESYNWDFGNGQTSTEKDPVAIFTDDGIYTIKLISLNQYDCTDTTFYEYNLLFLGLYVPNAFAPDFTNLGIKLFQPIGVNLKEYHVTVFDIWGHLMWESSALDKKGVPTEGWDGTFNGNKMPQGNYIWRISARFMDDSPWKGSDNGVGSSNSTMGTVVLIR